MIHIGRDKTDMYHYFSFLRSFSLTSGGPSWIAECLGRSVKNLQLWSHLLHSSSGSTLARVSSGVGSSGGDLREPFSCQPRSRQFVSKMLVHKK